MRMQRNRTGRARFNEGIQEAVPIPIVEIGPATMPLEEELAAEVVKKGKRKNGRDIQRVRKKSVA